MVGNHERRCCRYLFQHHTSHVVFRDDAQLGLGNPAVQNCHHANLRGLLMTVGLKILGAHGAVQRSEEHTSELQSLMRISYAVFCLKKKKSRNKRHKESKYTALATMHISNILC